LQGALTGARDAALHNGTPSGIRLLPDPAFPLTFLSNGQIDPTQPLAANRIIPIEIAPAYSEGQIAVVLPGTSSDTTNSRTLSLAYPSASGGGYYPFATSSSSTANVLMVKEVVAFASSSGVQLNNPTSWYWNIRLGDKLQINGSGLLYTVVGPMIITPEQGNAELFVNV